MTSENDTRDTTVEDLERMTRVRTAIELARFGGEGRAVGSLTLVFDDLLFDFGASGALTSLKRQERKRRLDSRRMRAFVEGIPCSAHILSASGETIMRNERWDALWSRSGEETPGRASDIRRDRRVEDSGLMAFVERALSGESVEIPPLPYAADGDDSLWIRGYAFPLETPGETECEVAVIVEDITGGKALEDDLRRRVFRDELTGLTNRQFFMSSVRNSLEASAECALIFLALDDFKTVNDTLGHSAGDELLVFVSERLIKTTRNTDTVARLGGDEFVILTECGIEAATEFAERLVREIGRPFEIGGEEIKITCSVGVATSCDGVASDDLLRAADTAMYRAKTDGKNCFSCATVA